MARVRVLWPPEQERPVACFDQVELDGHWLYLSEPVRPDYWDNGWPVRFPPNAIGVACMELGTRVAAALLVGPGRAS